ncbi:MAG: hypothetical protein K6T99_07330 [Armatimonadetes bacterium]|nr:hypothetical protein [Armatimonadota bacterium]
MSAKFFIATPQKYTGWRLRDYRRSGELCLHFWLKVVVFRRGGGEWTNKK